MRLSSDTQSNHGPGRSILGTQDFIDRLLPAFLDPGQFYMLDWGANIQCRWIYYDTYALAVLQAARQQSAAPAKAAR